MTIPDFSPSLFIGKTDCISFGSGQPDLPPPHEVYDILSTYKSFKYGLIQGEEKLRRSLVNQYPSSTPDSFVVTNGASESLDLSLRVISNLDNGKPNNVLLPRPYYYSYPHMVNFAGMKPVYSDLQVGRMDFDDIEEKAHECKVIMINSPSNPTGRIESISTLKKIEKLAEDLDIYIISDEVYKDLIYVRENYLINGPKVITVNSFSKTYSMCGFRVGYLWSRDNEFVQSVINMKTHTSMNTNILGQEMAYTATQVDRGFVENQRKVWEERRDFICEGLTDLGFDLWKPEGAFYVFPKPPKGIDPKRLVWEMYDKHKVISYLGEWFGNPKRVRFSYALDLEKIEQGLKLVEEYINR